MSAIHAALDDSRPVSCSYVGGATGVNSAALPAHSIGDLIVGYAFRDGSTTPPDLGAGFTNILNNAGTNCSVRMGYRVATVTNTASGTWTNASATVFVIYHGASIGSVSGGVSGADSPVTYEGFAPSMVDGSSLILGFAGHTAGDTTLETPPTGMVNRQTVAHASDEAAAHESSAGRYYWPQTSVAVGGSAGNWDTHMLEIKSA